MVENEQATYRRAFNAYVGLVRRTAGFAGFAGKLALKPVLYGMETPARLRPHIQDRLQAEMPRSEAKVALDAILRGRAHEDGELVGMGETMLTKAVQTATTSRRVPDDVTEDVLQIAHDIHLDPGQAHVDPFVARHVQEVLKDFEPGR